MMYLPKVPCTTERCACVRICLYLLSMCIGFGAFLGSIMWSSPINLFLLVSGFAAMICPFIAMFELVDPSY